MGSRNALFSTSLPLSCPPVSSSQFPSGKNTAVAPDRPQLNPLLCQVPAVWTSHLPESQFPPLQMQLFIPSSQGLMRTGLDKACDTPDSQERIKSPLRLPLIIPSPDLDSLVLPSRGTGSLSLGSGPLPLSAGLSFVLEPHHTCPSECRSHGDESSLGTLSFNGLPWHRREG